jgi:CRP-like cAMP-binding protein
VTERVPRLDRLEYLGNGVSYLSRILGLIPECVLFGDLSSAEAGLFAPYLDVYRCEPASQLLGDGESAESIFIVLEGRLQVSEYEYRGGPPVVDELGPGALFGERGLIDGEPQNGACVAAEPSLVAALHRENLARIIIENPPLGAKILMELLALFSTRLRATRARLADLLGAPGAG